MKPDMLECFEKRGESFQAEAEALREEGTLVVGVYCTFAPLELIRAAAAVPVGLCGKRQAPIAAAERILPSNLCPLIKSSYGYALTDTCPYFAASDLLVGETTCDGKKKMFEFMGRIKPLHLMHLPYSDSPGSLAYWTGELARLKAFLEERTGRLATPAALAEEIRIQNLTRRALKDIAATSAGARPVLSGLDMMTVMESKSFVVDQQGYLGDLNALRGELDALARAGEFAAPLGAPRILLTGCPVGKGSEKVLRLIEESGAAVVCQENCTCLKAIDQLTDEAGDPMEALARRYLNTPCSCLTPNTGRFELIARLIAQYRVQGVVDLTWQCCHTYNVESALLREYLDHGPGLPLLHIETDYSEADTEQLRTRIEAFLEMLS